MCYLLQEWLLFLVSLLHTCTRLYLCCVLPGCVTGVAALAGTSITGEVYAWVVVFVLPINSAINPVLYTISVIKPLEML